MPRLNIRHDITPHHATTNSGLPQWQNISDWTLLSEAIPNAGAMSAFTFRTFPTWQTPAYWVGFEVIVSSPSVIRLAALDYNTLGNFVLKTDWGPEFACPVGVRSGQMPITQEWNNMCNGPTGRMLVFEPQVKGSGVLYRAQLNIIMDVGDPPIT